MYVLTETRARKRCCSIKVSVYFSIELCIDKYIYTLFAFFTLKRHLWFDGQNVLRDISLFDFITRAAVGRTLSHILPTCANVRARIVSILLILPHRQSCSADAASHAAPVETQYEPKKRQGSLAGKNRGVRRRDVYIREQWQRYMHT